jgi:hypothetical protein
MAQFNINVPNKNLSAIYGDISTENSSVLLKKVNSVKNLYGNIIDEVSTQSNVPKELVIAMIIALSNGTNNNIYRSNDKLYRSGLFSLSNKTAKQILARELGQGRMSQKEIDYLTQADPKIGNYISNEKGTKGFNYHWLSDYNVGLDRVSDTVNSFNLTNPKSSIAIGTIWLGQLWDKYSEQTTDPIDKVIITALLPYNDNGWLSGNKYAKTNSWSTDYTSKENIDKIPKPAKKEAPSNIINPNKGWVVDSLKDILNRNGLLYIQTKK